MKLIIQIFTHISLINCGDIVSQEMIPAIFLLIWHVHCYSCSPDILLLSSHCDWFEDRVHIDEAVSDLQMGSSTLTWGSLTKIVVSMMTTWGRLDVKTPSYTSVRIPIIKIWLSHDRINLIMTINILGKMVLILKAAQSDMFCWV